MDYFLQLLKLVGSLGLIIGLVFVGMKQLKRKTLTKTSPRGMLQVVDGVTVGLKDQVFLLKVGNEYVLLSHSGHWHSLRQSESFDEFLTKTGNERSVKK